MSHISFSPVLGERVVVCVGPETESSVSAKATLHFTATFQSQQAYDDAKRDGMSVELWTDIPVDHRNEGDWSSMPFQEADVASPDFDEGFPLLANSEASNAKTLHLRIPVPRSGRTNYLFTHRLVYPSGHIKWLGHYGHDGSLVIERSDPRFTRGTLLDKDGESLVAGVGGWEDKEIAQLSQTFDWSIHAIQEDGSSRVHSLEGRALAIEAPVIFCVPIVRARSLVVPPTFSLAASVGSSFSINTFGSVLMTGPAQCSVSFQSYDAEMEGAFRLTAVKSALSFGGAPRNRLLNLDHTDSGASHAVLAAQEGSSPAAVSVVPLIARSLSSSPRNVRVTVQSLAALTRQDVSNLSLFCQSTLKSRFLAVPSDARSEEAVTLEAGPECGQFVVAPAYDLNPGHGSAWKVSIVTSHTPVVAPVNRLPTPPPSPIVRTAVPLPEPPVQTVPENQEVAIIAEPTQPLVLSAPEAAPAVIPASYFLSINSLRLWLTKFWLLRVLLYFISHRPPPVEAQTSVEITEDPVDEVETHSDEDDDTVAPSVTTAADVGTVAYLDEDTKASEVSPLLFDVAAGSVSMLVRPTLATASVSTDALKIYFDGMPVKRTVCALNEGVFLVEFSAGIAGGRVSVLSI